jgi:NAD(P)-dependent dehydrogenase (short-subunit alcohol dehydrogenase family)
MAETPSKAVLVTGCSTGIGRATAERLASAGWTVWATARRPETIAPLAAKGCRTLALDVCDEASMRAAVDAVEHAHGAVGVLVNNAGYGAEGPVEEVPMEEVRRQFETNVFGLLYLTKMVLPGMRRQGWGKIVNLSSMGGRMTLPGGGIYHATKHAVEALSDALRFEVRGLGIDVILIEPGMIKTEFNATAMDRVDAATRIADYDEFRASLKQNLRDATDGTMSKLAGTAEQVAAVIEKAITASRPKARYPVTMHARLFMGARKWLGARGFELMVGGTFKAPVRPS